MPAPDPRHPFRVLKIGSNLLEVKVEHEVELTLPHVEALHARNVELAEGRPYAILVEKTNHYSYSFDALQRILDQPLLFAMAFHISSEAQRPAVNTLLTVSTTRTFPIQVFTSRREALQWLAQQGADVGSARRT